MVPTPFEYCLLLARLTMITTASKRLERTMDSCWRACPRYAWRRYFFLRQFPYSLLGRESPLVKSVHVRFSCHAICVFRSLFQLAASCHVLPGQRKERSSDRFFPRHAQRHQGCVVQSLVLQIRLDLRLLFRSPWNVQRHAPLSLFQQPSSSFIRFIIIVVLPLLPIPPILPATDPPSLLVRGSVFSASVQTFLRGLKESQRRYSRAGVATSQRDFRYASGEPVRGHSTAVLAISRSRRRRSEAAEQHPEKTSLPYSLTGCGLMMRCIDYRIEKIFL